MHIMPSTSSSTRRLLVAGPAAPATTTCAPKPTPSTASTNALSGTPASTSTSTWRKPSPSTSTPVTPATPRNADATVEPQFFMHIMPSTSSSTRRCEGKGSFFAAMRTCTLQWVGHSFSSDVPPCNAEGKGRRRNASAEIDCVELLPQYKTSNLHEKRRD